MKIIILSLTFISLAHADTLIKCHDGDTCRFSKGGKVTKVRFSGIDAPEANQPLGKESRDFVTGLLINKEITLKCDGTSYDRKTCSVYVGEMDIQRELVRNGYAQDLPKFSRGKYKADEDHARSKKLGIWSRSDSVSAFCWRFKNARQCKSNKLFQPR